MTITQNVSLSTDLLRKNRLSTKLVQQLLQKRVHNLLSNTNISNALAKSLSQKDTEDFDEKEGHGSVSLVSQCQQPLKNVKDFSQKDT